MEEKKINHKGMGKGIFVVRKNRKRRKKKVILGVDGGREVTKLGGSEEITVENKKRETSELKPNYVLGGKEKVEETVFAIEEIINMLVNSFGKSTIYRLEFIVLFLPS